MPAPLGSDFYLPSSPDCAYRLLTFSHINDNLKIVKNKGTCVQIKKSHAPVAIKNIMTKKSKIKNSSDSDFFVVLQEYFRDRKEITAAYLFGSFATGKATHFSDLDRDRYTTVQIIINPNL